MSSNVTASGLGRLSESVARAIVVVVSVALATWFVGTTLYGIVHHFSSVPYLDEWDGYIGLFRTIGGAPLSQIWLQHVDHRIVTTKLVALVDWKMFGGLHIFIVACQIALQAGIVWLISHRKGPVVMLLASALMFSWVQQEMLTWSFAVQIGFVYFFALLAFMLYRRSVVGALAAAIVASLSMANGILVFPALLVQAVIRRQPKHAAYIVAVGAVTWGAYFYHYDFMAHNSPTTNAWKLLVFVCMFFGQPIYPLTGSFLACGLLGAFAIAAGYYFMLISATYGDERFAGVLVFLLLSAFAAAHGRAADGADAATASRYSIAALILWSMIIAYAVPLSKSVAGVMAVAVIASIAPYQMAAFGQRDDLLLRRLALLETVQGYDQPSIDGRVLYPDHYWYGINFDWAQQHRVGIFNKPWLNEKIRFDVSMRDDSLCHGIVDHRDGAFVSGWALGDGEKVVLVDGAGKTVGLGLVGAWRPDLVSAGLTKDNERGWWAYSRAGSEPTSVYLYSRGKFCLIGSIR
ncbi:hypothetical protein [Paraburkholderia unamae]|uniref:Glucosyltransferase GtrII-like protein n=1 Tax=Paraburkholderia unamae TaxID=219649 RepID=A0ABX5K702_9BURK|nr:hypothetical protein [Paraburkholderia unamae]PVX61223.1 hypothetical protein C7402_14214 [Paraburkholderia unamae]